MISISNNSIYTVSDVIKGWSPDRSLVILSSPQQYQNTILYKFLIDRTKIDGVLWNINSKNQIRGSSWVCGKWTHNCVVYKKKFIPFFAGY